MKDFIFANPLVEGVITKRKSQFTIIVNIDGNDVSCHCPTTGRVGDMDLSGRPCLLSESNDPNRKTPYTVEAVSLNKPDDIDKKWIGINQNAANRYVEHFLKNGGFDKIVETGKNVQREKKLGNSKFDFFVDNVYLEVKTPLQTLQVDYPDYIKLKKPAPFSSTGRFAKHMAQLAESLEDHQRAILLVCFIYDNPGFKVVNKSTNYDQVKDTVSTSVHKGVEMWQANFRLTPTHVELEKYFPLQLENIE
ncbi:MAG: DNA/RNA nuclease SfsA [Clostridiales bacterium]|nr:DNA/RNA nuclease SfsA [Clostridiales bacterium]